MAVEEKTWTIIEMIKWGTEYLGSRGFDEARLNMELLLSAALGMKRFDLYVKHDQPLKKSELDILRPLLKRRLAHEPIQYILGSTNFYSIELKVDSRALIPRPETEILADTVISHCKSLQAGGDKVRVLDIGTGSGCIAIAIAKFVPDSEVTAIDSSRDALGLAGENASGSGTSERIIFRELDFLNVKADSFDKEFNVIVSNPPYVSVSEIKTLDEQIKNYEPIEAVSDNGDGFTFFRKIASMARSLLKNGGMVFVETSYGQSGKVSEIFSEHGGRELIVKKDLSNIDRVVGARFFK